MSDNVQKIKQEIERRLKSLLKETEHEGLKAVYGGIAYELTELLKFIDSLPEEPFDYTNVNIIPKDFGELPQTIEQAAVQAHIELEECNDLSFVNTFSKGAEWQKQQMMKDAVEGEVVYQIGNSVIAPTDIRYKVMSDRVYIPNVKLGDKVKIIIIKPEQQ